MHSGMLEGGEREGGGGSLELCGLPRHRMGGEGREKDPEIAALAP